MLQRRFTVSRNFVPIRYYRIKEPGFCRARLFVFLKLRSVYSLIPFHEHHIVDRQIGDPAGRLNGALV